jgi:hypothetical protein
MPLETWLRLRQHKVVRHEQVHQGMLHRKRRVPPSGTRQPWAAPKHVFPVYVSVLCARFIGCVGRHESVRVEGVGIRVVGRIAHHFALWNCDEVACGDVEAAGEGVGLYCFSLDVYCVLSDFDVLC